MSETSRYCNKKRKKDEIKFLSLFHCSFDKKFQYSIDKKTNSHKTYFYNSIGNAKKSCKNHHESSSNSYVYFINIVKLTKKNHYAEKYTFTNSPSQISKTNFNMKKMSVALNIGQM